MIEVTGVDLVKLAKKAYDLSRPQGLGFLNFTPKPLTDEEAGKLVRKDDPLNPLDMDYVHGRSIKLTVSKKGDKLFLKDNWYDHTDYQYRELLESVGVTAPVPTKHNVSCNCIECAREHGRS